MSLCLGKRISELKANEFNLDLSGGEGEPLVVREETAAQRLTAHCPLLRHMQRRNNYSSSLNVSQQ